MKNFKILVWLTVIVLFLDCAKEEPSTKTVIAEENPLPSPKDSISDDSDTEIPLDSIPEVPIDSIPPIPIDSIPEIPIDTIPITYFRFQAIGNAGETTNSDSAIMIHSAEGDLLDFKLYEGGDLLLFQSTAQITPDNFTVSMIDRNTYAGSLEKNSVSTFPNVERNSFWTNFKQPEELPNRAQSNLLGAFNLAITDLPDELLRFRLSSYDGGRSQGIYNFENGSYTLQLDNVGVYEKNDFILTIVEKNYEKKYLKINNVQPSDDLVYSYNDLLTYDRTIEIELPSNFLGKTYSQLGMEEAIESISDGVYDLDSSETAEPPSNLPNLIILGFIDELQTYRTQVDIALGNYNFSYYKVGSPADNIILRNPNYNVLNTSLFDFKFNVDIAYYYRISEWRTSYNPNLEFIWSIVSSFDENPLINQLPENLSVTFPNIDIENLTHSRTSFSTRSITYSDFVQENFVVGADPSSAIRESESYTVPNNR